ncbi:MAG: fatty acid desaturase [Acidimicrobiales bacterium]|jgi:stearoyl-CoA desaturase (delta-9 desaturase)
MGPTPLAAGILSATDPSDDGSGPPQVVPVSQKVITAAIVAGPAVALGLAVWWLWGGVIDATDVAIALVLYLVTGFGVTVGFHRLFTHRGFAPHRALKITLAVLGSMAVEGSVTSWVATHRRHHIYSDRAGDPHSPYRYGDRGTALLRGLAFSHMGWLFVSDSSSAERYAPDLLKDRDIVRIGRLFPVLAVASLAIPFGIGYAISGTWVGALMALVWAGLVRMALLHHVTWSINSLCHVFGRRTEATGDRSSNLWPLAVVSLGESWHNIHHAHPSWARHGARQGMVDPSAWLIGRFEQWGWATRVRWPELGVDDLSAPMA